MSSASSSLRSHSATCPSDPSTFSVAPPTETTRCASCGSTARTVTGSTPPSFTSIIPNGAANFTSGGAASNLTASGKRSAFSSARPLASFTPAGMLTVAAIAAGNGPLNVRSLTAGLLLASSATVGARTVPSAKVSRTLFAASIGISAEKRTFASLTGLHPACGLTRAHSHRAANALRTVKSKRWSRAAVRPSALAIPASQTSAISRPGASGRRHFTATTVESAFALSAALAGICCGNPALSMKLRRFQLSSPSPSTTCVTTSGFSTSSAIFSPMPSTAQ